MFLFGRIDFENYNSFEEIMAYIDSVATNTAEYTDEKVRASVSSLGTTFQGRPIKMLKLALRVRIGILVMFSALPEKWGTYLFSDTQPVIRPLHCR